MQCRGGGAGRGRPHSTCFPPPSHPACLPQSYLPIRAHVPAAGPDQERSPRLIIAFPFIGRKRAGGGKLCPRPHQQQRCTRVCGRTGRELIQDVTTARHHLPSRGGPPQGAPDPVSRSSLPFFRFTLFSGFSHSSALFGVPEAYMAFHSLSDSI